MDATGYDPQRPEIKNRVKYMIQYLCRKYYAGEEALQVRWRGVDDFDRTDRIVELV